MLKLVKKHFSIKNEFLSPVVMSGEATYHILHFLSSYLTGERSDFES